MARGVRRLDAVQRLAVGGVRLAADVVGDAGLRHEVALVRRVDEDAAFVALTRFHPDRRDGGARLRHAAAAEVEPPAEAHGHAGLVGHRLQDALGDARLEHPHRRPAVALGHRVRPAVPLVADALALVLLAALVDPGRGLRVVRRDPLVERARQPADRGLVADVGVAEPARREAPEPLPGLDQDDGAAHVPRLDGGDDTGSRAAVDDEIESLGGGRLWLAEGEGGEGERGDGLHEGPPGTGDGITAPRRSAHESRRHPRPRRRTRLRPGAHPVPGPRRDAAAADRRRPRHRRPARDAGQASRGRDRALRRQGPLRVAGGEGRRRGAVEGRERLLRGRAEGGRHPDEGQLRPGPPAAHRVDGPVAREGRRARTAATAASSSPAAVTRSRSSTTTRARPTPTARPAPSTASTRRS